MPKLVKTEPLVLNKLLRLTELPPYTGMRRTQIMEMVRLGEFPKPVRLSARAMAWKEKDILAWQNSRPVVTPRKSI